MPIHAIARLIQTMLYSRRFFPYYVYNILGGIEDDGEFFLYTFTTLNKIDTLCYIVLIIQPSLIEVLSNPAHFFILL